MSLELLGYLELPANTKQGRFDLAAVHRASGRLYIAHTANDALDVIDCDRDCYLHSIHNLLGAAGALVAVSRTWCSLPVGQKTQSGFLRSVMRPT